MPISAFKLITPTSIVVAGGTASVGQFGKVSFSAATSLSLDGVFSSTYDNYMIVVRGKNGTGAVEMRLRLRASGTDNTTASSYVSQALSATSTTVTAFRDTQSYAVFSYIYDTQRAGYTCYMFGPNLAQPTAMRVVSAADDTSARVYDNAMTHNQSTSYDGFTLYPGSSSLSGEIAVYGCNQ